MECEKEVLRLQKKLDKIVKSEKVSATLAYGWHVALECSRLNVFKINDEVLDYLKALKDLPINLQVLTSTRIGMTVNAIRKKSENEEVNNLTKALIKKWKKLLPGICLHRVNNFF